MTEAITSGAQRKVYQVLSNLEDIAKVSVRCNADLSELYVAHTHISVPDFKFVWDAQRKTYLVHIMIASPGADDTKHDKGVLLSINSGFAALGFSTVVGFFHKHRSLPGHDKRLHAEAEAQAEVQAESENCKNT